MQQAKLIDVCTIQYGYPFDSTFFSNLDGMPLIRIRDVVRGYSETFTTEPYKCEYVVHKGDILVGMDGEFNVAKWDSAPALLNQRVCRIIPKSIANSNYVFFALPKALKKIEDKTSFATVKHLSAKEINKITFPFPDLSEQAKIAGVLENLQTIINSRNQQLSKLDELVKARFIEMFGEPEKGTSLYPTVKLKELSIKISDGIHAKPDYTETGKPFLSVVNINRKKVDFTNCKFVSEEAYQQMIKTTHPEKGDVLYTKVGATYGIPAYVDTDIEFCLYVSVCLIKPNHDLINSKFLTIQMDMPFIKHQADSRIKGIGVPDLHLNQISEFEILYPPRKLQNQFAAFVTQVEKAKSAVQKALDKAQLLFDSLMQTYFG